MKQLISRITLALDRLPLEIIFIFLGIMISSLLIHSQPLPMLLAMDTPYEFHRICDVTEVPDTSQAIEMSAVSHDTVHLYSRLDKSTMNQLTQWEPHAHVNPVLKKLVFHIYGGESPAHLQVRIVDHDGTVHVESTQMQGRTVHLEMDTLREGPYIADVLHKNEVIMRHRFNLLPQF